MRRRNSSRGCMSGLYLEATGDATRGREHIAIAAAPRYAAVGGYMHDVARVHMMVAK